MRCPLLPTEASAGMVPRKTILEQRLGTETASLAYLYGSLKPEIKRQARAAGFHYAVAIDTGGSHLQEDRFHIFRVKMFPHEMPASLRKKNCLLVPPLLPLETQK